MLFEWFFSFIFKVEAVVAASGDEGGVDNAIAGIEEDFGRSEGLEVGGCGVEDAMIEAAVAGVVAGEATGDGGRPEDEPAFVVDFVVEAGAQALRAEGSLARTFSCSCGVHWRRSVEVEWPITVGLRQDHVQTR